MNSRFFKYAGIAASILLIAFGIGSVVSGINGRNTVHDNLALEQISGYARHDPDRHQRGGEGRGEGRAVSLPTCSVANKAIDSGSRARCFASYMRIHALEATDGRTYSQMGQFLTAQGKETSDKALAGKDPRRASRCRTRRATSGSPRPRCRLR